ncbi:MAG: hypothetical protein Q9227_006375 [Pyrenula ochraceoflavens]
MATSTLNPPSGPGAASSPSSTLTIPPLKPTTHASSSSTNTASHTDTSLRAELAATAATLSTRLANAVPLSSLAPLPPHTPQPTIPLIDLAPSFSASSSSSSNARHEVAQQIRTACLTTGFFQITNHGIPERVCNGILQQARRLFHELSPTQKEKLHMKGNALFRGWEPSDWTSVYVGQDEKKKELKEAFNWGWEPALELDLDKEGKGEEGNGYVELDGKPLDAAQGRGNVWPKEEELPGFFEGIREYYVAVMRLARHLCGLFAIALGLEERYFDGVLGHPGGIGRLIWYPAADGVVDGDAREKDGGDGLNADEEEEQLGLGAHTDYECFTLLLSSSDPGLEILLPPEASGFERPVWVPCPVREGTLTVNIADFLQRWTNGRFKSTVHRVVNQSKAGKERYSVPLFFSINYDAKVKTLPGCEQGEREGGFGEITAGEWVLERLRATREEE